MEINIITVLVIVAIVVGIVVNKKGVGSTMFHSVGFLTWPIILGIIGTCIGFLFCGIGAIPGCLIGVVAGLVRAFNKTSGRK